MREFGKEDVHQSWALLKSSPHLNIRRRDLDERQIHKSKMTGGIFVVGVNYNNGAGIIDNGKILA